MLGRVVRECEMTFVSAMTSVSTTGRGDGLEDVGARVRRWEVAAKPLDRSEDHANILLAAEEGGEEGGEEGEVMAGKGSCVGEGGVDGSGGGR